MFCRQIRSFPKRATNVPNWDLGLLAVLIIYMVKHRAGKGVQHDVLGVRFPYGFLESECYVCDNGFIYIAGDILLGQGNL